MHLVVDAASDDDAVSDDRDEILSSDLFGKYAILWQSESAFIQAASDWQPTDECLAFMKLNDSDPRQEKGSQEKRQKRAASPLFGTPFGGESP